MSWKFWEKKKPENPSVENEAPLPDIDIPDLKKEEKEKKKGGVPIGAGSSPGTTFLGAKGGVGAASSAARVAAQQAASSQAAAAATAAARAGGTQAAGLIARLTATTLGKAVVGLAAVALMGAVAIVVYNHVHTKSQAPGAVADLGAIDSGIKVDRNADSHTRISDKDRGMFAAGHAPGAGRAPQAGDSGTAGDIATEEGPAADGGDPTAAGGPQLEGQRVGALSSSLDSGQTSASSGGGFSEFGERDKLTGAGNNKGFDGEGSNVVKRKVRGSKMMQSTRFAQKRSRTLARLRGMGPYSQRMGQGATATEAHATDASTQFEETAIEGGAVPVGPDDTVDPNNYNPSDPPGGDIPDGVIPPLVGPKIDISPFKDAAKKAKQLIEEIQFLMILAAIFAAIGCVMAYISACSGGYSGTPFFATGLIMAGMAYMKAKKLTEIGEGISGADTGATTDLGAPLTEAGEGLEMITGLTTLAFVVAVAAPLAGGPTVGLVAGVIALIGSIYTVTLTGAQESVDGIDAAAEEMQAQADQSTLPEEPEDEEEEVAAGDPE